MADVYKHKFEKLIMEYGKLVIHLKTLKRSYFECQGSIAELAEQLRHKEKTLRKNEIEIDSLNFRNKQLTKRISVLQLDLDNLEGKATQKCQSKFTNKSLNKDVVQEELQKRIMENSNLACQLQNNNVEIQHLKETLEIFEKNNFEKEMKYKCDLSRLKHQNQKYLMMLQSLNDKFKSRSLIDDQIENELVTQHEMCIEEDFSVDFAPTSEQQQLQKMYKKSEEENELTQMQIEILKIENELLRNTNKHLTETSISQRRESFEDEARENPTWNNEHGYYSCDVGKLSVPFKLDEEIIQREQTIIEYFHKCINKIKAEKQYCESLISLYAAEYEALTLRSNWQDKENNSFDVEL